MRSRRNKCETIRIDRGTIHELLPLYFNVPETNVTQHNTRAVALVLQCVRNECNTIRFESETIRLLESETKQSRRHEGSAHKKALHSLYIAHSYPLQRYVAMSIAHPLPAILSDVLSIVNAKRNGGVNLRGGCFSHRSIHFAANHSSYDF